MKVLELSCFGSQTRITLTRYSLNVELKGSGREVTSHTCQIKQFLYNCKIRFMPTVLVYAFFDDFLTRSCGQTIIYYLTQSINFSN